MIREGEPSTLFAFWVVVKRKFVKDHNLCQEDLSKQKNLSIPLKGSTGPYLKIVTTDNIK